MKGLQFSTFGDAADVLDVVEFDEPAPPGPDEVMVGIEFSPLNFHDLFFIGGHLAPPALPAVPGNEGIGTVLQAGSGVTGVDVGDRVVLPLLTGAWRERVTVSAAGLFALPNKHIEQLAMLGSNVPAAGLMLSEYGDLAPGDWVIQNAANGGVGRSVIALAHHRGLRTVNVVRRFDAVDELRSAGADVVVVDHPEVIADIRAQTRSLPITLGIDSIGGVAAATVLAALSPGSTLVSYGNASGVGIDAEVATAKNVAVSDIFVGAFDYLDKVVPVIKEAVPLIESGWLHVPIEAIYELDDIKAAIDHLLRGGKILLHISTTTKELTT